MPLDAQTRLLRVLQDGEYTTIGGRAPIEADVRIIAATHRDLSRQVRQGHFREDLYYRLNVVPIRLPPLRERTEDIRNWSNISLRAARKTACRSRRSIWMRWRSCLIIRGPATSASWIISSNA